MAIEGILKGHRGIDERPNNEDGSRIIQVAFNNVEPANRAALATQGNFAEKEDTAQEKYEGDELGDFEAGMVWYAQNYCGGVKGNKGRGRTLVYFAYSMDEQSNLDPRNKVVLNEQNTKTGETNTESLRCGDWRLLPEQVECGMDVVWNQGVIICGEGKHEFRPSNRKVGIVTALNGEFGAHQVKIAHMKEEAWLGGENGHSHPYYEAFTMFCNDQEAIWQLAGRDGRVREYRMRHGEQLIIPPETPHRVLVPQYCTLIGATQWAFLSPKLNDKPYEGKWPTI